MSKKGKKGAGPAVSGIKDHKFSNRKLTPPLAQLPNVELNSWRDERAPSVLWAVLLTGALEREAYLALFMDVAKRLKVVAEQGATGILHEQLAQASPEIFEIIFAGVLADPEAKRALRPLLFFESLPDRSHWERTLFELPKEQAVNEVSRGLVRHFDHQSEQATDCRWLVILSQLALDKMRFQPTMRERVLEIIEYPNRGDMRAVRPSIRAMEGGFGNLIEIGRWAPHFWDECWQRSECILPPQKVQVPRVDEAFARDVANLYFRAASRFFESIKGTMIDAKHDAAFGILLYAITLAMSLNTAIANSPGSRILFRCIVECAISLCFLEKQQDESWVKYRSYGAGQAKLAYLKALEISEDDLPDYLSLSDLEALSNEDMWQEFLEISVASWAGSDLRKMSETAGVKWIYDRYYGWPSVYVHGNWSAVRDTVFTVCLNPLHRLHRIPAIPRSNLNDMHSDVSRVLNVMCEVIDRLYSNFSERMPRSKAGNDEPHIEDEGSED